MTKWTNTTALYHVTTECMSCGYEDVVGVPIINIPEVRALVEAATHLRAFLKDEDRVRVQSRCLTADLEFDLIARKVDSALAPFDSPAQPTTLVDSSGRYEVKRD